MPPDRPVFDDRLATVLRARPSSRSGERTQFLQLLDLLGSGGEGPEGERLAALAKAARALPAGEIERLVIDPAGGGRSDRLLRLAGFLRLEQLQRILPADEQAAMLREAGPRLRNPALVALIAHWPPRIAAAAIAAARLTDRQWAALIPGIPVHARGFLRQRRDLPPGTVALLARLGAQDLALPQPLPVPVPQPHAAQPATGTAPQPPPAPQPPVAEPVAVPLAEPALVAAGRAAGEAPHPHQEAPPPGGPLAAAADNAPIGALLQRIERFRVERQGALAAPRLPLGDGPANAPSLAATQFEAITDALGMVVAASPAIAPLLAGMRLTTPVPGPLVRFDAETSLALRLQQKLRAAPIAIAAAPEISGAWLLDGMPAFDPLTGAFAGYHVRLRRAPVAAAMEAGAKGGIASGPASAADRMRQVMHELRTPVGAIQGFAEIIQQQVFGHVPHEYRAYAAAIAADAARLLAGFEELDRLARLEGAGLALAPGASDFRAVLEATIQRLDASLRPREARMVLQAQEEALPVAIEEGAAMALCWRVLATLAGALGPGETLRLLLGPASDGRGGPGLVLACALPEGLRGKPEAPRAAPGVSSGEAPASPLSAGMFGPAFAFRLAAAEARAAGGALKTQAGQLSLTLPCLTSGAGASHSQA